MPPAARQTDWHECPEVDPPPHVGGPITDPCEPTVLIGNLPAARLTDMAQCVGDGPDTIAGGSSTVFIGNLPAARMGDPTVHGGMIIMGDFTVIIGD
jgi:uncharacterized Zn-binding protein involved in type VI secretion